MADSLRLRETDVRNAPATELVTHTYLLSLMAEASDAANGKFVDGSHLAPSR